MLVTTTSFLQSLWECLPDFGPNPKYGGWIGAGSTSPRSILTWSRWQPRTAATMLRCGSWKCRTISLNGSCLIARPRVRFGRWGIALTIPASKRRVRSRGLKNGRTMLCGIAFAATITPSTTTLERRWRKRDIRTRGHSFGTIAPVCCPKTLNVSSAFVRRLANRRSFHLRSQRNISNVQTFSDLQLNACSVCSSSIYLAGRILSRHRMVLSM